MGVRPYNESRAKANKKYNDKTYKQINVVLRKEDDADIISMIEEARSKGLSYRDWLRDLVDNK